MEKINIAELLKDCPSGMELDCTMYDSAQLNFVLDGHIYPIKIQTPEGIISLTEYGCYSLNPHCKCVILPKGKTTWEGFVPPCTFKDGDIIFTGADSMRIGLGNTWISIFEENRNGGVATYVDYCNEGEDFYTYLEDKGLLCMKEDIIQQRLATEEEKQKLFKAIKDNGFRWNSETKTLEKSVEPRFKVGNEIVKRNSISCSWIVDSVTSEYYELKLFQNSKNIGVLPISEQDEWELFPKKFDITTLKPFDKVLVRDFNNTPWEIEFFSRLLDGKHFKCLDVSYIQCIPYEGNEHLLGTSNDCDDYYKTWEN